MIHHPRIACEHACDRIDRYRRDAAIHRAVRVVPRESAAISARRRVAAAIYRIAAGIDVDAPRPSAADTDLASVR